MHLKHIYQADGHVFGPLKFIENTKNAISSGKKQFFWFLAIWIVDLTPHRSGNLKFFLKSASFKVVKSTLCFLNF